jgi:4-amino-4-deoxy-L-arabinose transferase-like glycosyltransferase
MSMSSIRLQTKNQRNLLFLIALGFILIAAFILRYKAIKFGFPIITHPDEPVIYGSAVNMIKTRNLHPKTFLYPSFYIYLQALLYKAVFFIGKLRGIFQNFSDVSYLTLYFWGRFLTVVMSTGTIFLTYLLGRRLLNQTAALLSALFVSLTFLHLKNSFLITTDSPMGFWVLLSFLMSAFILTGEPKLRHYLLNGLFIGLAIGTKYNAVFILLPLIAAHLFKTSFSLKKLFDKKLLLALFLVPVVFVLTTPYAVLDFPLFWDFLKFQNRAYQAFPFGIERNAVSYGGYFHGLLGGCGIIQMILAGFGLFFILRKSLPSAVLLISFPLPFYLFMGAYPRVFMRNMVAIVPFLSLLGAFGAFQLTRYLWRWGSPPEAFRRKLGWVLSVAVVIGTGWGLYSQGLKDYHHVRVMTLPNTRWLAEIWIKRHIPAGARIIKESYTPSIIKKCKVVDLGVAGFAKKRIRYNLEEFDYIILSSGSYNRFFADPESFPDEVRIYRSIMSTHPLRKIIIPDNRMVSGPVIRIYEVRKRASV